MGEGTRGEGIENNHLQSTSWHFWNSVRQQTQQPAFPISWQNVKVNLSADVRFPVDTNLKEMNTFGRIAAFSIWLDLCLLKEIFIASILDIEKFCSSKTLKNNSSKQACCFRMKDFRKMRKQPKSTVALQVRFVFAQQNIHCKNF